MTNNQYKRTTREDLVKLAESMDDCLERGIVEEALGRPVENIPGDLTKAELRSLIECAEHVPPAPGDELDLPEEPPAGGEDGPGEPTTDTEADLQRAQAVAALEGEDEDEDEEPEEEPRSTRPHISVKAVPTYCPHCSSVKRKVLKSSRDPNGTAHFQGRTVKGVVRQTVECSTCSKRYRIVDVIKDPEPEAKKLPHRPRVQVLNSEN